MCVDFMYIYVLYYMLGIYSFCFGKFNFDCFDCFGCFIICFICSCWIFYNWLKYFVIMYWDIIGLNFFFCIECGRLWGGKCCGFFILCGVFFLIYIYSKLYIGSLILFYIMCNIGILILYVNLMCIEFFWLYIVKII